MAAALFTLTLLVVLPWSGTYAQTIEGALMPGPVIEGHVKVESDCSECHVRFDRAAQDALCVKCHSHKEIGTDLRDKRGFHGRIKPQACRSCHTDHKGRAAKIVVIDEKTFDHKLTNYELKGAHTKVVCRDCHAPDKKYRAAPGACIDCHRKDDEKKGHKGGLGTKCAECHDENKWKETKFDHDKTKFALRGGHADPKVKCLDCHKDNNYKDTPRTCIGCHKADDNKSHKGLYGEKCETCHGVVDWKKTTFNHDTDTKFALRDKHRTEKCASCHKGHLYKEKLTTACFDCHKKDDKHNGTLGKECGACHNERDWKESPKFDHDKTKFQLRGAHADPKLKCTECHKDPKSFRNTPTDCYSCHKKDDKHENTLGEKCADCHTDRNWKKDLRFDHDKTKFALRGGHADPKVKCVDCHKDQKSFRKTPIDCYSCHKKDDKHEGQLSKRCETCHGDRKWTETTFDHGQSRFPLTGRHIKVPCKDCHKTLRYKDASLECYECHKKEDKHKLKFGLKCQSCHNTRNWSIWDFDHDKRTEYKLDGAHTKVACETCHAVPAPAGKAAAPLGKSCFSCHRADDVHDGAFGTRCENCHQTTNWKKVVRR